MLWFWLKWTSNLGFNIVLLDVEHWTWRQIESLKSLSTSPHIARTFDEDIWENFHSSPGKPKSSEFYAWHNF